MGTARNHRVSAKRWMLVIPGAAIRKSLRSLIDGKAVAATIDGHLEQPRSIWPRSVPTSHSSTCCPRGISDDSCPDCHRSAALAACTVLILLYLYRSDI